MRRARQNLASQQASQPIVPCRFPSANPMQTMTEEEVGGSDAKHDGRLYHLHHRARDLVENLQVLSGDEQHRYEHGDTQDDKRMITAEEGDQDSRKAEAGKKCVGEASFLARQNNLAAKPRQSTG